MNININKKRVLIGGILVFLGDMIVGNLLWMNPLSSGISERFKDHHAVKSFEFLGGLVNWLLLTMLFGLLLTVIFILLYLKLFCCIPGRDWTKGLLYGVVFGLLRAVPEAFNQWMIIDYPLELILLQFVNTGLGYVLLGLLTGFIFSKLKVVKG